MEIESDSSAEKMHKSPFTRKVIKLDELYKVLTTGCNHGVCGGRNLGNTCFMNSSIACLSNCTELTTYFLTGEFKNDINKKNKEGLGGDLAYEWYKLLKEYWLSSTSTGNPRNVKDTVARKYRKFAGYGQQDSNEFMTCFLEILSEDLNKTTKKIYTELKEKGEDEDEVAAAKRFWDSHVSRNNSIITDLFSGLYKSSVTCPNCNWKNITFDPFNVLVLPIPEKEEFLRKKNNKNGKRKNSFFYIPYLGIRRSLKVGIITNKNMNLKDALNEAKKINEFYYKSDNVTYMDVADKCCQNYLNPSYKNLEGFIFIYENGPDKLDKDSISIPIYLKSGKKLEREEEKKKRKRKEAEEEKGEKYSAFPRNMIVRKGITFGELKLKCYYYIRKYLLFSETANEVDQEITKFEGSETPQSPELLINLMTNEYKHIIENCNNEDLINNFPYKIFLTEDIEHDYNQLILFNGKNVKFNKLGISGDEDSCDKLLKMLNENNYKLVIEINPNSNYSKKELAFDRCAVEKSEHYDDFPDEEDKGKYKNINYRYTLDDLLSFFTENESLDIANTWYCKKCRSKVMAEKKVEFYYLPRILNICLKRFSKTRYGYEKNNEQIDFPINNLDMSKHVCGPDKGFSKYDLYAVSQHYGGTGGGHYTAECKNFDGRWYSYNDSSCSHSSESQACSSAAYVLYYRRQNW